MKKHFYFAALFLTSAFTACTQDEDIAVQRVNNESPVDTRTSVVNREDVSIADISQISANFWAKTNNYTHMNWGWGLNNGWFLDDNITVLGRNYEYDRQNIINIHPK